MSTAALPASYPSHIVPFGLLPATTTPASRLRSTRAAHVIRRRPTRSQGMALEALGHAVEYLVDSRLYEEPSPSLGGVQAEDLAVRILMRLSREVFATCAEVVPVRRRISRWLAGALRGGGQGTSCVR